MLVADSYLGHRDDESVADRLADANPARVILSDTGRRRSRVRTTTESGTDLGIVVSRDLADGDVLETEDGTLVVVELAAVEALVLDFTDANVPATTALELGHAVGNRHWNLALRGESALFPVPDSRERMESFVEERVPEGVTIGFESVPPTTFDDETRTDHAHGDGSHAHSHSHAGHDHDHSHGVHTIGGDDR